jgi:O-acetyl-ADP-ribose deacetylase (regulator of RNase III)
MSQNKIRTIEEAAAEDGQLQEIKYVLMRLKQNGVKITKIDDQEIDPNLTIDELAEKCQGLDELHIHTEEPDGRTGWVFLVFGNEPGVLINDHVDTPLLNKCFESSDTRFLGGMQWGLIAEANISKIIGKSSQTLLAVIERDILEIFEEAERAVLIHQCNCHKVMGAGIARTLANSYPEVEAADQGFNPKNKLGKIDCVQIGQTGDKAIINAYSQGGHACSAEKQAKQSTRLTNYEAVATCIHAAKERAKEMGAPLLIPYGYGCGLGGGDWNVVQAIILSECWDWGVFICKLPPAQAEAPAETSENNEQTESNEPEEQEASKTTPTEEVACAQG